MRSAWMLAGVLLLALFLGVGPVMAQDTEEGAPPAPTDEQRVAESLKAAMAGVGNLNEEVLGGAFSEKAVIVLSFMGVRVLDRAGLLEWIRYEDVSGVEFGEPEVTLFDGVAFVTVPIKVPGYADGAMYAVMVRNTTEQWQIMYAVIDPMSNMVPTSRKEKGEAMLQAMAEDMFRGITDGSLTPIASRLSQEHICLIASIPPMAPMVFTDYNQIANVIPMAEPMLAAFPTPEVLESGQQVCNGVLVGWYDLQLPQDVVMRAMFVAQPQGEEAKIIGGIVAFRGDVMGLVSTYAPGTAPTN